jgi:protein SCO1/2
MVNSTSLFFLILLFLFSVSAHGEESLPVDLEDVTIQENLGDTVPLSSIFYDETGKEVPLSQLVRPGIPVVLNLVYYECPMLCNLVLNGLSRGLNQMDWTPGHEFDIITISIDPGETHELAAEKKEAYLSTLNVRPSERGWRFLTGTEANIQRVADAVGFKFNLMEDGEYAHGASLFVMSSEGVLSRYLYGIEYKGFDIKRSLLDAMDGKQISALDKVLMFCYRYDQNSRGYVLFAQNFMRSSGYLVLIGIVLLFGTLWMREIRNRKKKQSQIP